MLSTLKLVFVPWTRTIRPFVPNPPQDSEPSILMRDS